MRNPLGCSAWKGGEEMLEATAFITSRSCSPLPTTPPKLNLEGKESRGLLSTGGWWSGAAVGSAAALLAAKELRTRMCLGCSCFPRNLGSTSLPSN